MPRDVEDRRLGVALHNNGELGIREVLTSSESIPTLKAPPSCLIKIYYISLLGVVVVGYQLPSSHIFNKTC